MNTAPIADQIYILPSSKKDVISKGEMISWYLNTLLSDQSLIIGPSHPENRFHVLCARLKGREKRHLTFDPKSKPTSIRIDTSSRPYIFSHSYKLAILLDLSESSSFVHYRYKLVNAELIAVQLQSLLEQLCEPVHSGDGVLLFKPQIHISIMAHFPISFGRSSERLIVNCFHLEGESCMEQIMNMVNSRLESLVHEIWSVKSKSNKMIGSLDLCNGDQCRILSDLSNELCNILNSGIMLLNMMPDSECHCGADMFGRTDRRLIVLITDGLMSISNPGLLEAYRKSLIQRHIGLCVIVAEPPEVGPRDNYSISSRFSYDEACISSSFKSATIFAMVSTSMESLGSLVVPRVNDHNFEILKYPLHKILICGLFTQDSDEPDRSSYVVKNYAELRMPFSVPELACLKIAGLGFAIRSSVHGKPGIETQNNGDLVVHLVRSCIGPYRLCCKITGSSSMNSARQSYAKDKIVKSVVTISIESDQKCNPGRRKCIGTQTKFLMDETVARMIEVDRTMVSFMNAVEECTSESFKSTVPVFIRITNSGKPNERLQLVQQLRRDHSTTKFCMIWKSLLSVHPSYWRWYLRDFKMTILLEHDNPLPKLVCSTEVQSASAVGCKTARQELNDFLQEYFQVTLLENQIYLKFVDQHAAGKSLNSSTRFCLLHVSESAQSPFFLILRFYFSHAANQEMCTKVLGEISRNIPVKRIRQASTSTLASMSSSHSINQYLSTPLSKKNKRCSIVDRHLLRMDTQSFGQNSVLFHRLPRSLIHELIVDHQAFPFQLILGKQAAKDNDYDVANDISEIQRTAFSRFFHRRLWVRTFANFENNEISLECAEAIVGSLVRQRLSKGFHFARSNDKGIHVLINEFSLTRGSEIIPCLVQYVIFPIHCEDLFYFSRILEKSHLKANQEVHFVTEIWIEPHIYISSSSSLNGHLGIADQIKFEDDEIFRSFISLEYMLPCRIQDLYAMNTFYERWNAIICDKSHNELVDWVCPSHTRKQDFGFHHHHHHDIPQSNLVQHLPFSFNYLPLLDQSSEALAMLTCFQTDQSNAILLDKLNGMLSRPDNHTFEFELFKNHEQMLQWINRALKRIEIATKRSLRIPAFIGSLNPDKIGWKCFLKPAPFDYFSHSACLVIMTPDLEMLASWNEHIRNDALSRERHSSGPCKVIPVFFCYLSKPIMTTKLWANVSPSTPAQTPHQSSSSILQMSGSFSSSIPLMRTDMIVFDYARASDENQACLAQANAPIGHPLTMSVPSSNVGHSSVGYKPLHYRKRDRSRSITIHSPAEEEAINILCHQCDELRENFDNTLISAVFDCARNGIELDRNDLEFALSICIEKSNEIEITDLIKHYCVHMKIQPALMETNRICERLNFQCAQFKQRFTFVVNQYFQPVPSSPDIFYYSYEKDKSMVPKTAAVAAAGDSMQSNDSHHSSTGCIPFFITFSVRFISLGHDKITPITPNKEFPLCLAHYMTKFKERIPTSDLSVVLDVVSMIQSSLIDEQLLNDSNNDDSLNFRDESDDRNQSKLLDPNGRGGSIRIHRNMRHRINYLVNPPNCSSLPPCVFYSPLSYEHLIQPPQRGVSGHSRATTTTFSGTNSDSDTIKILKRQRSVMAMFLRELKWVITDQVVSAMNQSPISVDQVNIVADHILKADSIGKHEITCNCRKSTQPLKFIMAVQPSYDAFLQEIEALLIETGSGSRRAYKLVPVSDDLYLVILVSRQIEAHKLSKRRHSWCRCSASSLFLDNDEQSFGFGLRKRIRSDHDLGVDDRDLARSTSSLHNESLFQDFGSNIDKQSLPRFWLLLKFRSLLPSSDAKSNPTHFVDMLMQIKTADLGSPTAQEADTIFNKLTSILQSVCLKVNKKMILLDLEDTRMCAHFLVPDEDEGSLTSSENIQDDKYLAAKLDISIRPGEFACDLQWTAIFSLHPRLRTFNVRHSKGFTAVESALHTFIIYNRRNMFVYRRIETSSIYYMIVKEHCLSESKNTESNTDLSNNDQPADFRGDSSKLRRKPVSYIDHENMLTRNTFDMPTIISSGNRVDSAVIQVYGLNEPDQAVKDHIIALVSKRLDCDTLGEILDILHRNSKCRLYADDVQFIKRNQESNHVSHYAMPNCDHFDYINEFMHYLKQSLTQFLIVPNYSDDAYSPNRLATPSNWFGTNTNLTSRETLAPTRTSCPSPTTSSTIVPQCDRCFCFIHTIHRGVGVANQGLAWIEMGICGADGEYVSLPVPSTPTDSNLKLMVEKGRDVFEKWTYFKRIPQDCPNPYEFSKYTLKIKIWKRGELDVCDLSAKLEPCLANAIILLLTEYTVLSDPFPAVIHSMDNTSPTLTPKSRDRSSTASPEFAFSRNSAQKTNMEITRHNTLMVSLLSGFSHQTSSLYHYGPLNAENFKFILEWFDFANAKYNAEFKKQSHSLPYNFLVVQALEQFMRWLRLKLRLDIVLYTRSSAEEYTICEDTTQLFKRLMNTNDRLSLSNPSDLVLIVRDIELWMKIFNVGTVGSDCATEDTAHHTSCYSMRYEPFQCDQKDFKYCVPRQAFVIVHLLDKQLTLFSYNWSLSLSDAICSQLSEIWRFQSKRATFLTSLLLQQVNIYHMNVCSSSALMNPLDISSLLTTTTTTTTTTTSTTDQYTGEVKKSSGNSLMIIHQTQTNNSSSRFDIDAVRFCDPYKANSLDDYLRIKRILPLDIVLPAKNSEFVDPINIFGRWAIDVRDIYTENAYHEEKLRGLYESWLVRQNAPITANTLSILKQNSRCIHSVSTPLLFYNHVRECIKSQLSLTIESTMMLTPTPSSHLVNVASAPRVKRRKLSYLHIHRRHRHLPRPSVNSFGHGAMRSFSAIVGPSSDPVEGRPRTESDNRTDEDLEEEEDIVWKQDIANRFFSQYQNYLATVGFSNVVISEAATSPLLIQKTIRGVGIVLIEMVRSSEEIGHFFVVRVYLYEHEPSATDVLLSIPNLEEDGDRTRDITHFNSFTYDFHLRLLYGYLAEKSEALTENYPVIAFLHDFLTYYVNRPIYAQNIVWQEDWFIDILAYPSDVYTYIIEHGQEYEIAVKKMNIRYQSPSFILRISELDSDYSVCRLAYFPTPRSPASRTLSEQTQYRSSSESNVSELSIQTHSVEITAFTIMLRKEDSLDRPTSADTLNVNTSSLNIEQESNSNIETPLSTHWLSATSENLVKVNEVRTGILPTHTTYTKHDDKAKISFDQKIINMSKNTREFFQHVVSDASKSFLRDRLWNRLVQWNCSPQKRVNNTDVSWGPPLELNEFEELLKLTYENNLTQLDIRLDSLFNLPGDLTVRFLEYISAPKSCVGNFHDVRYSYVCIFCGVHDQGEGEYRGREFVFSGKSGTSQLSVYGRFEITEAFILIKVDKRAFRHSSDDFLSEVRSVDGMTSARMQSHDYSASSNGSPEITRISVVRRSKNVPHAMAIACVNAFVNASCYFLWNNLV